LWFYPKSIPYEETDVLQISSDFPFLPGSQFLHRENENVAFQLQVLPG
jgi:hypothetical protein